MDPITLALLAGVGFVAMKTMKTNGTSSPSSGGGGIGVSTWKPRVIGGVNATVVNQAAATRANSMLSPSTTTNPATRPSAPAPDYVHMGGQLAGSAAATSGCQALGPTGAAASPLCGMVGAELGGRAADYARGAYNDLSSWVSSWG